VARRLESELERTRGAVASLRRLLQPEPPPLDVELRAVPATTVAAVEDDVAYDEVLAWYAGAIAELDAVVHDLTGVPGGLYDNALFEDGRGHALLYRPTAHPPRSGRVHPVTLPAVELAVTTHVGEHGDIEVTYGELGTWWWATHSRWPARCGRPTWSAPATRPTRRPGEPRSAGRSSAWPRVEAAHGFLTPCGWANPPTFRVDTPCRSASVTTASRSPPQGAARSPGQTEHPRRVVLEDHRPHLVLDLELREVGLPPIEGEDGEVGAEQHLALQQRVRRLHQLRREVLG
jgi:hypothetical protein